jgi:uncharacterized protein YecE (DUF72 family)
MSFFHVGTMGWSYDFWKGSFYPEGLDSRDFLHYYSSKFDTVEVDGTFYRIPRKQTVVDWKQQTPSGFVFSLKFPRVITHVKMLKDCEEQTRVFLERVALLEEKLGPLLLQFTFSFGKENEHVSLLREFLKALPKEHRYVVEVRNRKLLGDSFYSILRDNRVALAWVDSPSMPVVDEATSDFIYIRWEGDRHKVNGTLGRMEIDRTAQTKLWAERIRRYLDSETEVFGYFSKYYSGYPTADAHELLRLAQA